MPRWLAWRRAWLHWPQDNELRQSDFALWKSPQPRLRRRERFRFRARKELCCCIVIGHQRSLPRCAGTTSAHREAISGAVRQGGAARGMALVPLQAKEASTGPLRQSRASKLTRSGTKPITEIATPQPESGDQSEAGSALASRRPIGRPPIASELVPGLTANSSKPLSSSK